MTKQKTVFFDRDGTLIIDRVYLNDPDQITYLPDVFEALSLLRDRGYKFVIVTNQSGIARGIVSRENLDEIHRRITVEFAKHDIKFAGIYDAPYSVESNHFLRKPNPGMLLEADKSFGVDFKNSWMVGDRMSDVEAGHRAGCRTVLLSGVETPEAHPDWAPPEIFVDNLLVAARKMIAADGE